MPFILNAYKSDWNYHTLFLQLKYLKTAEEYKQNIPVIQRNTDIVQKPNTNICGHLCLFVLKALSGEHWTFQQVLNHPML